MARVEINPEVLLSCDWQELRTELVEWKDCDEGIQGFDGLTRYWCRDAVFEIYWIAEKSEGAKFDLYLTEDMELAGFKSTLSAQPSSEWKRNLAETLAWRESAHMVLDSAKSAQLDLFKR